MSYILEALKKSEQERRIGAVPDLSMVQEPSARTAPRWPRWLLGALLLNAVILVFVAWRVWDARQSAGVPAGRVAAVAPAPAPDLPIDAGPVHAAPETQPAVTPPAAAAAAPVLPEPVSELPAVAPAPESAAQIPQSDFEAPPLGPDLEPLPDPQQTASAETVVRWEDLPPDQQAGLPVPRIDVHVFASEPERRFVLINLRKYLQGDTLDSGAVIETILADGLVLSYQGQQYRVDRP